MRAVGENEVFKVLRTGKRRKKAWKRMVTKVTYVGEGFTRKPPKYERFIRPMALRFKKAHVTHPELKATFCLPIIGVKKNPQSPMYTQLGVITKGTVIEVNISELGLVTQSGKVIWGEYLGARCIILESLNLFQMGITSTCILEGNIGNATKYTFSRLQTSLCTSPYNSELLAAA